MGGNGGDIVNALNYQVKAEVVKNYLRERLILEEEVGEYRQSLETLRKLEAEVRKARDDLACLLGSPYHYNAFFKNIGFEETPLAFLEFGPDVDFVPACPLGLSPKGITKRSRFVNLVGAAYSRLAEKTNECAKAAQGVFLLAAEINEDIRKFHVNHDLMSIIQFIKNMDVNMVARKNILGSNFTPEEMGSIEEKMVISKLKPDSDGVRTWPELPPPNRAIRSNTDFLHDIFQAEREAILPALTKAD